MTLLIIRHGQSEADLLDVHEGRADYNLTEKGHKQAEAMAQYVKNNFKIDKIYASPLKRAAQTAGHLSEATGVPVIFEEDLMEFNNGLIAGLTRKEADEKYPEVKNLPINQAVYEQESLVDFRNRAAKMLWQIRSNAKDDETIAVVSHGGMINQLYHALLRLPVKSDTVFGTGDTGIHVWKMKGERAAVIQANYTDHTDGIE